MSASTTRHGSSWYDRMAPALVGFLFIAALVAFGAFLWSLRDAEGDGPQLVPQTIAPAVPTEVNP